MAGMINLCFHGIGQPERVLEQGEADYWISADLYDEILREVAGRSDVRITFDDGNASDVDIALEGLLHHGMNATFFPLAGRLDQPGSLSEEDLRHLRAHDMTIGTHGMDHRPWRGMDPATRHRELVEARERLRDASRGPVEEAALPLGRYDRAVLNALRREGYRSVHTSDRRPARTGAWLQPRYSVHRTDTIESIREKVLRAPMAWDRLRSEAKGVAKRLR